MRIEFYVGQARCVFTRSHLWGEAKIQVGSQVTTLQSLLSADTFVSLKLLRVWEGQVDGHHVRIEKRRPLLFAGFRPHAYVVSVDGTVIDSRSGY